MKVNSISNNYSYKSFGSQTNTDKINKGKSNGEILGDCCLMLGVPFLIFDTFVDGFDIKPKSKWSKVWIAALGVAFLATGYNYIKNMASKNRK